MSIAIGLGVVLLAAFGYRLRGGGFITFSGDTLPRIIWAMSLTAAAFLSLLLTSLSFPFGNIYSPPALILLVLFPLGYLVVVLIPHQFSASMGKSPAVFTATPKYKWWPAFYNGWITQQIWTDFDTFERVSSDAFDMAIVGLLRGLFVFTPIALAEYFAGFTAGGAHDVLTILMAPVAIKIAGQPLAYILGMWAIPGRIQGGNWNFSELLDGASWGLAVLVFTQLLYA